MAKAVGVTSADSASPTTLPCRGPPILEPLLISGAFDASIPRSIRLTFISLDCSLPAGSGPNLHAVVCAATFWLHVGVGCEAAALRRRGGPLPRRRCSAIHPVPGEGLDP